MKLLHNLRKSLKAEVIASILVIVLMAGFLNYYITFQIKELTSYSESIEQTYLPAIQTMNQMEHAVEELDVAELSTAIQELNNINQAVHSSEIDQLYAEVTAAYDSLVSAQNAGGQETISLAAEELSEKIHTLSELYNTKTTEIVKASSDACSETFTVNQGLGIITLIVSIGIMILMIRVIVTPTIKATAQLDEIIAKIQNNEGDLSVRIQTKKIDEIGRLVNGINHFIEQLQRVMLDIKTHSGNLQLSAATVSTQTEQASTRVSDIVATMEELSATMEEVSSTVTEMDAGAENIMNAMDQITLQTNDGSAFAGEMKERAIGVQQRAKASHTTAQNMISNIETSLNEAITHSQSVNRIEELTEDILSIASQTNLLALNASIEAARAGEAGKGFAVVADQIRILAAESRQTANNIQEISQLVIGAVGQLTDNASQMLQFTGETVMEDYEVFLDATKHYQEDAIEMEKEMAYFRQQADGLKETLSEMTNGINGISISMNESSRGINETAEAISQVSSSMSDIEAESGKNDSISHELTHTVERFRNI